MRSRLRSTKEGSGKMDERIFAGLQGESKMGGLEEEDGLEEKDELEGDRRGWALRCTPKMLLRSRMRRSVAALRSLVSRLASDSLIYGEPYCS